MWQQTRMRHFFGTPSGVCFFNGESMKRIICAISVITILLSGCSVPKATEPEQTANYTQGIYELTFLAKRISHDRVGNDWTITYIHNGQTVKSGHKILLSLELFAFQAVKVEVREDDKLDDVGTGDMVVAICDGGSGKTTVTVTENGGPYKGETAVWEITCTVKLVGKQ